MGIKEQIQKVVKESFLSMGLRPPENSAHYMGSGATGHSIEMMCDKILSLIEKDSGWKNKFKILAQSLECEEVDNLMSLDEAGIKFFGELYVYTAKRAMGINCKEPQPPKSEEATND